MFKYLFLMGTDAVAFGDFIKSQRKTRIGFKKFLQPFLYFDRKKASKEILERIIALEAGYAN